jgi:hypothetical protein
MFNIFKKSRVGKVFSSQELSQIDNICRNINKYTKMKHHINFNTQENDNYGEKHFRDRPSYNSPSTHQDLVTHCLSYDYIFFDCRFELRVNKIVSVDKKTSEEIMNLSSDGGVNSKRIMNLEPFNHSNALNEISALELHTNATNYSAPMNMIKYIEELSTSKEAAKPEYQAGYDKWRKDEVNMLNQSPILDLFKEEIKKKKEPINRKFKDVHNSDQILITYNEKWLLYLKVFMDNFFKNISMGIK